MCGIIGGVSNSDITHQLMDGLKRLEYRGYDSSGLSILSKNHSLMRARTVGKVNQLESNLNVFSRTNCSSSSEMACNVKRE